MNDEIEPIVDLGYAKYRGRQVSKRCTVYLGVPYARPPVGNLRFRRPESLDTSGHTDEITDATQYPLFAMQGATGSLVHRTCPLLYVLTFRFLAADDVGGAGSEDCLKVDIYAPSDASQASGYPVLAYIHVGFVIEHADMHLR